MTTYTVTSGNYNSPAFWSSITSGGPHTLDVTGLPANWRLTIDSDTHKIGVWNGSSWYTVGEAGASGVNTHLAAGVTVDVVKTVQGSGGNDYVEGTTGNDSLVGNAGADTLSGDRGADTISGGTGNDFLTGGSGSDSILGGDGNDNLWGDNVWVNPTDIKSGSNTTATSLTVTNSADGPIDLYRVSTTGTLIYDRTLNPGQTANIATYTQVNWIITDPNFYYQQIIYGTANQTVTYGGNGLNDTLYGGAGDDSIYGEYGNDLIYGGTGADQIFGGYGNDTVMLESAFGNDTIQGGEGGTTDVDMINASLLGVGVTVNYTGTEAGTITDGTSTASFTQVERFTLTNQNDSLNAGADTVGVWADGLNGNDTLTGGSGNDTLAGGAGNDSLLGGDGNDTLLGGDGNDSVHGGAGADSLLGGAGDDTLYYGTGGATQAQGDYVDGGTGNDIIDDETGTQYSYDDTIHGGAGNDTIWTGGGNDLIYGEADNDVIYGEDGNDTISGGTGNDLLFGQNGIDRFVYAPGDGHDTIADFNNGNTGTLADGNSSNNEFIDLSSFYDDIWELYADQADDGILNQSNQGVNGVNYADNAQFGAGSLTFWGANATPSFFTVENTGVICFASGTRILTPAGERPVETLRPGDVVTTLDNGPQRLIWTGFRQLDRDNLARGPTQVPVVLAPSLTGGDAPLVVSPQHGVLLRHDGQEVLIRAVHLARMRGGMARRAQGCRHIRYHHLMFERHQIVFANGAPAESFYPGKEAVAALDQLSRARLALALPDLPLLGVGAVMGPTARPFAGPNALPEALRALRPYAAADSRIRSIIARSPLDRCADK